MIDIAFMKGQVVNLEQKHAEAVQAVHEIAGGLTYARNLLAYCEDQAKKKEEIIVPSDAKNPV